MVFSELIGVIMGFISAIDGTAAFGAGIAALTGLGSAIAMGMMVSKSAESIARQPEVAGQIRTNLMLGLVFAETTALFGMVVAIMLMVL